MKRFRTVTLKKVFWIDKPILTLTRSSSQRPYRTPASPELPSVPRPSLCSRGTHTETRSRTDQSTSASTQSLSDSHWFDWVRVLGVSSLWRVFLTWSRKPGWCPRVWFVRPERCLSCPCCTTAVGTECSPSLGWFQMGLSHCRHTQMLSSTIVPQPTDRGTTKVKQKGHYSG